MEYEQKMRTFELIHSNEWQLIKELLQVYANNLVMRAVQLTAEEANDRKRTLLISSAKYFEDFIKQLEGQGHKEALDSKEQAVVRQTIPEF